MGLLPLVLTVLVILCWHQVELANYRARGSGEGFMGPGLMLVFGFPYLIAMVVADILAAIAALKRE